MCNINNYTLSDLAGLILDNCYSNISAGSTKHFHGEVLLLSVLKQLLEHSSQDSTVEAMLSFIK